MGAFGRQLFLLFTTLAVLFCVTPSAGFAQQGFSASPLEVRNDRGGRLRDQIDRLEVLRRTGQPVRIVGDYCYSTCTMYLGLPQTCVLPTTVFGFHGPSNYGKPLESQTFEKASSLIVAHYPPVLHDWYLAYGRHEIRGVLKVSGAHLIRIGGAKPCTNT